MRDFRRLQNDPPTGVQGAPLDNNIMVQTLLSLFLSHFLSLISFFLFVVRYGKLLYLDLMIHHGKVVLSNYILNLLKIIQINHQW